MVAKRQVENDELMIGSKPNPDEPEPYRVKLLHWNISGRGCGTRNTRWLTDGPKKQANIDINKYFEEEFYVY